MINSICKSTSVQSMKYFQQICERDNRISTSIQHIEGLQLLRQRSPITNCSDVLRHDTIRNFNSQSRLLQSLRQRSLRIRQMRSILLQKPNENQDFVEEKLKFELKLEI